MDKDSWQLYLVLKRQYLEFSILFAKVVKTVCYIISKDTTKSLLLFDHCTALVSGSTMVLMSAGKFVWKYRTVSVTKSS